LNIMAPDAAQQYNAAKQNFVTAVLRKESGAAISQSEFDKEDQKYFPQPETARRCAPTNRKRGACDRIAQGAGGTGGSKRA
jgi:hypothetical protein